jgi:hypothetical protein
MYSEYKQRAYSCKLPFARLVGGQHDVTQSSLQSFFLCNREQNVNHKKINVIIILENRLNERTNELKKTKQCIKIQKAIEKLNIIT